MNPADREKLITALTQVFRTTHLKSSKDVKESLNLHVENMMKMWSHGIWVY